MTIALAAILGTAIAPGLAAALPTTTQPGLALNRLIRTSPFTGSTVRVRDNEGSAYVASDDSLWMVDDNSNAAYEINRTTGALKRTISEPSFANAPRLGVGTHAGSSRDGDLEAVAYDANADVLYLFSGSTSATPTVFRLVRDASGVFQVESWQPLASEHTGAGWRLADRKLYVANGSTIQTFDYTTGALGPGFTISGLTHIFGLDFDDTTGDLLAVNNSEHLVRASMTTRTILPGWNVDLTPFGIADSRAVEVIGEQLFISDGLDTRASNDPMNHAIFVFDVGPRAVTVHWTTDESARIDQLVTYYSQGTREGLVQFGIQVLAFLNAVDPQPRPTPIVLPPPTGTVAQTVTYPASTLARLDTVKARWAENDEDAQRLGFSVLSFIAALNGH